MTLKSHLSKACLPATAAVLALAAGLVAMPPLPAHAQTNVISTQASAQRVQLGLNKSVIIDLPRDAYDILVSNPAIADAVTRTSRRIYLFGKQVGETNIFVFGPNGEQIASLDIVVERDVAGLEAHLARFIAHSEISVELVNDNVVLTGKVRTPQDAQNAARLAEIFVSGGEATTGQYAQTAGGQPGAGVSINNPDGQRRASGIVNLLSIDGEDQVTLKVTVAEVSRNVMKQLGVNLIGQTNGIEFNTLMQNAPALFTGRGTVGGGATSLSGYLQAMEQAGVMRTLAEPTLTAISGEKATFRVGGEFNVVVGQTTDAGNIIPVVNQIEYGIGLEFQPVVLSPGRISLKIRTSVSEPTTEGSIEVAGNNLLSLRKRLADTTVELPSGGSMMIAGLVNDNMRVSQTALPGLSNLPVLGSLFRSREFVRNETELVILVTPYLAQPVARNQLARPDDNFAPASDGAGFFLGRVNRVYGTMNTDRPAGRYHGVVGYIYK
ncbi:BON domain-containing protein [Chelativorans sp. ZYF759]|nr:BON domain-containing protein [Chelativorans sp. ZYF759]